MKMIVLSTETWDAVRQARKELLFKTLVNRVDFESLLYIEPMTLWWRKHNSSARNITFGEKVRVCRWYCPLPGERVVPIQLFNRFWQAQRIARCLNHEKDYYAGIFYHPANWLVAKRLANRGKWFFDWTEDWGVYQQSKWISRLQIRALREASGVVADSESLYKKACEIRGSDHDVLLLPNATSLIGRYHQHAAEPADLLSIARPRIGFMGHIGPWIDVELIVRLATLRVDWQWCILGDARGDARKQLNACSNVHLLGIHPYDQLPDFMAHLDVLVAPYNNKAEGDSSKLYDYLVSGKPIVSSKLDTSIRLSTVVSIVNTTQQWMNAIQCALDEQDEGMIKKRKTMANTCTWEARAEVFANWLDSRL